MAYIVECAGRLSDDYTVYVAHALAVDKLIKALHKQPQLISVDIILEGPTYPDPDGHYYDPEQTYSEERDASEITAKLFEPAWKSLCEFLQHEAMLNLRCDNLCIIAKLQF